MNDFLYGLLGVVVVFLTILISMTIHELMHGWVAYRLGDDTAKEEGRLTLNPIKHLDPVYSILLPLVMFFVGGPIFGGAKPVPVDFRNVRGGVWGMALVALAGPLTNFVLAFIGFLVYVYIGPSSIVGFIAQNFMLVNLGFCCFNMLPIPPLDGSRVIYAILPDGVRSFFDNLERTMGVWLVYIIILLFGSAFSGVLASMVNGIYGFFLWIVGV